MICTVLVSVICHYIVTTHHQHLVRELYKSLLDEDENFDGFDLKLLSVTYSTSIPLLVLPCSSVTRRVFSCTCMKRYSDIATEAKAQDATISPIDIKGNKYLLQTQAMVANAILKASKF